MPRQLTYSQIPQKRLPIISGIHSVNTVQSIGSRAVGGNIIDGVGMVKVYYQVGLSYTLLQIGGLKQLITLIKIVAHG